MAISGYFLHPWQNLASFWLVFPIFLRLFVFSTWQPCPRPQIQQEYSRPLHVQAQSGAFKYVLAQPKARVSAPQHFGTPAANYSM